jgi:hypothetical protein
MVEMDGATHDENLIWNTERTVLLQMHKGEEHEAWADCQEDFGGAAMMINLDCSKTQNKKICNNPKLRVKSFPTIRMFPFGDEKQDSSMKYSPSATFEDIEDEILEDLDESAIQKLDQTNMQAYVDKILHEQKIGLLLYHNGHTPLYYRALQKSAKM